MKSTQQPSLSIIHNNVIQGSDIREAGNATLYTTPVVVMKEYSFTLPTKIAAKYKVVMHNVSHYTVNFVSSDHRTSQEITDCEAYCYETLSEAIFMAIACYLKFLGAKHSVPTLPAARNNAREVLLEHNEVELINYLEIESPELLDQEIHTPKASLHLRKNDVNQDSDISSV